MRHARDLDATQHPTYLVVQDVDNQDYLVEIDQTTGKGHWRDDIGAAIQYIDSPEEAQCLKRIHGPHVRIIRQFR